MICQERLTGPGIWGRKDVSECQWRMPIPPAALAEIEELVLTLRRHPMETVALDPRDYALDACYRFMGKVREALDNGVGLAVLDRLPTDTCDKAELKKIYWLLSAMIARPVAQSFDGRLLYDVLDTGARIGTRVRGDLTRQELSWHTDYGFMDPIFLRPISGSWSCEPRTRGEPAALRACLRLTICCATVIARC